MRLTFHDVIYRCIWDMGGGSTTNLHLSLLIKEFKTSDKCFKVFWQKTTSPSCHPSQQQMCSSTMCYEQAHSPAVTGKVCYSGPAHVPLFQNCPSPSMLFKPVQMGFFIYSSTWTHKLAALQMASWSVQPFLHSSRTCSTHRQIHGFRPRAFMHSVQGMRPKNWSTSWQSYYQHFWATV